MDGEERPRRGLPASIAKGAGLVIAFAAAAALFSVLLRPLALEHNRAPAAAIAASAPRAAVAVPPTPGEPLPAGPRVAILVTELGEDAELTARTIERLPPAFGLAFLPDGSMSRPLARRARVYGHEIWVGLPMQPLGWPGINPGPNTLLLGDPPGANAQRVEWALAQVDRPVGAYTMMGSAFTADAGAMAPVAAVMRQHGLVLLDVRSTSATVAARTVAEAGGRALSNDLFVDNDPRPAAIAAALDKLAARARDTGQAVGIARALPATLQVLPQWAEQLEERGVSLVPPSRLAP